MIIIDDREDLTPASFSHLGVECTQLRLEAGDYCWAGNGPDNRPVMVGVERKKIHDIIDCMRDRRLSGFQAPLMYNTYDVRYLLIESLWRVSTSGCIETLKGRDWVPLYGMEQGATRRTAVMYQQLDAFLASLEQFFGFSVAKTSTSAETVQWLNARYNWWQKPWNSHRTGKDIYAPTPGVKATINNRGGYTRREPTMVWKMAAQLPGIDSKAEQVADYFATPVDMVLAGEVKWKAALGIVGKHSKVVDGVIKSLREGKRKEGIGS